MLFPTPFIWGERKRQIRQIRYRKRNYLDTLLVSSVSTHSASLAIDRVTTATGSPFVTTWITSASDKTIGDEGTLGQTRPPANLLPKIRWTPSIGKQDAVLPLPHRSLNQNEDSLYVKELIMYLNPFPELTYSLLFPIAKKMAKSTLIWKNPLLQCHAEF